MACTREKGSFQIGFEDSVEVGRSKMMREVIPKRKTIILCLKPREARAIRCEVGIAECGVAEEIEIGRAKFT